jgi:hypothetical protein
MPPVNSCQDLTDEEPDDEENATFENLPVSQLRAEDVWEDDDDIPLGLLQVATRKKYNWMDSDSRSKVTSLQFFFFTMRCLKCLLHLATNMLRAKIRSVIYIKKR